MQNIIKTHNPALQIRMRIDTRIQDRNADSLSQNVQEIDSFANWCTVDSTMRGYVFSTLPDKQLLTVYNTLLNKYSSQYTARYLCRVIVTDGDARFMQQGTAMGLSQPLNVDNLDELPGFSAGEDASWTMLVEDPLQFSHKLMIPVMRTIGPAGRTPARST